MNYKRRKPRRSVRCVLCTPGRQGNSRKYATKLVERNKMEKRLLRLEGYS